MMTVRQVSSARGEIFSFDSWICFPQPCTRAVLAAGRPGIQISTLNVLSGPHPTRLHGSLSKNIFKLHILGGKPYGGASLPTRKIFTADPIVWQPESAPPQKSHYQNAHPRRQAPGAHQPTQLLFTEGGTLLSLHA